MRKGRPRELYFRVGGRQFGDALLQRAEVQHRATDQQRYPSLGGDGRHLVQRVIPESSRRIRVSRIADIDKPRNFTGRGITGLTGNRGVDIAKLKNGLPTFASR